MSVRGNVFVRAATMLAVGSLAALSAAPGGAPARAGVEVDAAGLVRPGTVGCAANPLRETSIDVVSPVASGDVVGLPGGWRAVAAQVEPQPPSTPPEGVLVALGLSAPGIDVQTAVLGDVDRDGADEVVVLFLRPSSPTIVGEALPGGAPIDDRGRSQHLGVYDAADLRQVWVAGTVLRPVSSFAVCDDVILLGYTSALGAVDRVGIGVITWRGYGFVSSTTLPDLPGDGAPACADVDRDGRSDPVVLGRTVS